MERTNTQRVNDLIITDTQIRTEEEKINKASIENVDRSFIHKTKVIIQAEDYDENKLKEEGYVYQKNFF